MFDLFFKDMDRSLREMGVGDLGVPKKIQKMGNIFYGLLAGINEAMDRGDARRRSKPCSRATSIDGADGPACRRAGRLPVRRGPTPGRAAGRSHHRRAPDHSEAAA